jgi:hypothetical protein
MGSPLGARATLVSAADRPVLPRDLAGTVAHAGVDATLEGRALQDALRAAIATRSGYCWWDVDHAGWAVTLDAPERQEWPHARGNPRVVSGVAHGTGVEHRAVPSLIATAVCDTVW